MIVVYTTTTCPRCVQVKAQLKAQGKDYIEMIVGRDITRETFRQQYPDVRSFPHVVELPDTKGP
jgi:glutaredoxin